jgi:hypothetical protein
MKARKLLASADIFLTSTNAITEEGHLVNIDHAGQRVAAMIFGPQKVIIIAGVNKIVRSVEHAMKSARAQELYRTVKNGGGGTPFNAT